MRLEEKIASLLVQSRSTCAVAESCTGGLLSHTLTNIPGSSTFFYLGIIAYDNAAKIKVLGVSPELIKKHGAVSAPVTLKMAEGVRRLLKTDYGIGVSGIAGPGGATKTKPIGLTYIALSRQDGTEVFEFHFKGNRLENKKKACQAALRILGQTLAQR